MSGSADLLGGRGAQQFLTHGGGVHDLSMIPGPKALGFEARLGPAKPNALLSQALWDSRQQHPRSCQPLPDRPSPAQYASYHKLKNELPGPVTTRRDSCIVFSFQHPANIGRYLSRVFSREAFLIPGCKQAQISVGLSVFTEPLTLQSDNYSEKFRSPFNLFLVCPNHFFLGQIEFTSRCDGQNSDFLCQNQLLFPRTPMTVGCPNPPCLFTLQPFSR